MHENKKSFPIKVVIADDHPALIAGLVNEIVSANSLNLVGTAKNSTEVVAILNAREASVLVTDYAMPGGDFGDGISYVSFIRRKFPEVSIIVHTMIDNPDVIHALISQNVNGILSKSDEVKHIVPAIHVAHAGSRYYSPLINNVIEQSKLERSNIDAANALSKRELEVVRLYVSGLTVNEIAEQLQRSKQTISTQKHKAMKKLGITRDADLYAYGKKTGLVPSPSHD